MLNLLSAFESTLMLQLAFLFGGIATFCAAMLSRANPLCFWIEWAGGCCDDDAGS